MKDMPQTIVAGFDGTPSSHEAVRLAARLAEGLDAALIVTFVYHLDRIDLVDTEEWRQFLRGVAERELEPARAIAPGAELLPYGAEGIAKGLQQLADERHAAFIVVGSGHQGPIGRVFPGSVGQRLLHGAPCPVAIASRGWQASDPWPHRLLVGYDGSPEAGLAVDVAGKLAAALGCAVRLISVAEVEPAGIVPMPGIVQRSSYGDEARERRNAERRRHRAAQLEEARARIPDGVAVETEVLEGDPDDVLVDACAPEDVLLVGSRGYGPVGAVLLGSVAASVVRRAPCPVIVTPRSAI
jgi:nucleotide-binding universal stress UspA family protein